LRGPGLSRGSRMATRISRVPARRRGRSYVAASEPVKTDPPGPGPDMRPASGSGSPDDLSSPRGTPPRLDRLTGPSTSSSRRSTRPAGLTHDPPFRKSLLTSRARDLYHRWRRARPPRRSPTRCGSTSRSATWSCVQFQRVVERRDGRRARQPAEGAVLPRASALPPALLPVGARGLRRDRRPRNTRPPLLRADAAVARAARVAAARAGGHRRRVGRYGTEMLEQFNTTDRGPLQPAPLSDGPASTRRRQLRRGDLSSSAGAAARPSTCTRSSSRASRTSARRAQPAVDAFRASSTARRGRRRASKTTGRMRDLAWLELARVSTTRRGEHYRLAAVEAWNHVDVDSEYWLDALFEESWAFFLADDYPRALGNIHTLNSPYFNNAYYPEALVLKAVIFFSNCQLRRRRGGDRAVPRALRSRPSSSAPAAVPGRQPRFFEFLKDVRDHANLAQLGCAPWSPARSPTAPPPQPRVRALLEAEEAPPQRDAAAFRNSRSARASSRTSRGEELRHRQARVTSRAAATTASSTS
jgi:hypothetical protein